MPEDQMLVADKPWDEVADTFRQTFPGVDESYMRRRYEQVQQMQEARARYTGLDPDTAAFLTTPSPFPFTGAIAGHIEHRQYQNARERIQQGRPEQADYDLVAKREEFQRAAQGRSLGAEIGGALASVPAMLVESVAAGPLAGRALGAIGLGRLGAEGAGVASRVGGFVARQAAATPLMPSLYAEDWAQRGGRVEDLPPALGLGVLQNLVLGATSEVGGGLQNYAARLGARTGTGVLSQQLADVAAFATGLKSGYGTLDDLLNDRTEQGLRSAAVSAVTFAAFNVAHGNPGRPSMEAVNNWMNRMSRAGLSRRAAGEHASEAIEAVSQAVQEGNRDMSQFSDLPSTYSRGMALDLAESLPPEAWQGPPRPPEPPPPAPTPPDTSFLEPGGAHYLEPFPANAPVEAPPAPPEPPPAPEAPPTVQAPPEPPAAPIQPSIGDVKRVAKSLGLTTKGSQAEIEARIRTAGGQGFLDALTKPPEPPVAPQPQDLAGMGEQLRRSGRNPASIQANVRESFEKGGIEAVNNRYPGNSVLSKYAREVGRQIESGQLESPKEKIGRLSARMQAGDAGAITEALDAVDASPLERWVVLNRMALRTPYRQMAADPQAPQKLSHERIRQIEKEVFRRMGRPELTTEKSLSVPEREEKKIDMLAKGKTVPISELREITPQGREKIKDHADRYAEIQQELQDIADEYMQHIDQNTLTPEIERTFRERSSALNQELSSPGPKKRAKPTGGLPLTPETPVRPTATGEVPGQPTGAPPAGQTAQGLAQENAPSGTAAARGGAAGGNVVRPHPEAVISAVREAMAQGNKWQVGKMLQVMNDHFEPEQNLALIASLKQELGLKGQQIRGAPPSKARGINAQAQVEAFKHPFNEFVVEQIRKIAPEEVANAEKEGQLAKRPADKVREDIARIESEVRSEITEEERFRDEWRAGQELADVFGDEAIARQNQAAAPPDAAAGSGAEPAPSAARTTAEPGAAAGPEPGSAGGVRGEPPGAGVAPPIKEAIDPGVALVQDLIRNQQGIVAGPPGFSQDVAAMAARVRQTVSTIWNGMKELGGKMFPRIHGLDQESGEATVRYVAANGYAKEAAPYYIDKILGDKADQNTRRLAGAVITERRLRQIRETHNQDIMQAHQDWLYAPNPKAKADAFDLLQEARQKAARVKTIVGQPNSPLASEAEYQQALNSPFMQEVFQRYREHFVPVIDDFYRRAAGLEDTDPINSRTQIPGEPVNLKHYAEGEQPTASTVFTGEPPARIKNVKIKRDVFAQEATGAAFGYDIDLGSIIENSLSRRSSVAAKAEMFRTMESKGVGFWEKPGQQHEGMSEVPFTSPPRGTQAAKAGQTSFYVHSDALPELVKALDVNERWGKIFGSGLLTRFSLASTVEVAYHGKNLMTMMMKPGMSPINLAKNAMGIIRGDPAIREQLVDLARIGALKESGLESGTLWGGKWDPTTWGGKFLDFMQRTMRLTADNAFDKLHRSGLVEGSEANRRDFINQLGQYNRRGQNKIVAWLRDTGLGPFATAGSNYYAQGLGNLFLSPGVKATSPEAAFKLRMNVLGRFAAVAGAVAFTNWRLWGRADGDDNTPFGAIKLGSKEGKTSYFDLTNLTGLTRGLRETGLLANIEGRRAGARFGPTATKARDDIIHSLSHPVFGPVAQFIHTMATGENAMGMRVSEEARGGENQAWNDFIAAAWNANPLIATVAGKERARATEPTDWRRLLGPFGVRERKRPPGAEPGYRQIWVPAR